MPRSLVLLNIRVIGKTEKIQTRTIKQTQKEVIITKLAKTITIIITIAKVLRVMKHAPTVRSKVMVGKPVSS